VSEIANKKRPLWIIIVALLVLIALLASASAVYLFLASHKKAPDERPINKLTLNTYTVNLADNSFRRYIRLTLTLEYEGKELTEEMGTKKHRINDAVISLLTEKKAVEMMEKETIRRELKQVINSVLRTGEISGIYFEEFIIQ